MHKGMTNVEIAELLRSIAASYELKGEGDVNRFKIIAYERAADAVEHLTSEAKDLWDDGKLEAVGGIGPSITKHLDEIFRTGSSKHFEELMQGIPPATFELMKVPGIGPKTAFKVVREFKISAKDPIGQLEKIAREGKISELEGFGSTSQSSLLQSIAEFKSKPEKRLLLSYAAGVAEEIIVWMKGEKSVKDVQPLGSLRRKVATVGDIDIAAASDDPGAVIKHFCNYPNKNRVFEKGDTTAGIIIGNNVHVDLMVQPPAAFGALLQHFTGSKHHNVALREYALKKGLSLSEYGIKDRSGKIQQFETEEAFYRKLGLKWIPPELREDAGEIEAAREGKLPKLIELKDVVADLQMHTNFDIETSHDIGASTMQDCVKKADRLGYEYIAFTEHNPSRSKHTDTQIVELLKKKKETVVQLNYSFVKDTKYRVQKVYNSLEIDIMPDGRLPVPEQGLQTLDFALVSIHSSFKGNRETMTKRVLSGLAHPKVKIFAHPTARLLNNREGIELNWEKIFDFCLKNDKWLEINADPARLDLPDVLVHDAVKAGVKLTLGTDAHHADGLENMRYGVWVARRGWATKSDIVNTRSFEDFEKMIL